MTDLAAAPEPTDAQLAEDERMVAFRAELIGMVEPDPGVRETEAEVQARFPDADADEVAQAVREVKAIVEGTARDHAAAVDRLGRQRSDVRAYRGHLRARHRCRAAEDRTRFVAAPARTGPRARGAGRPRGIVRASSRGGDSGDPACSEGDGEPPSPGEAPPLARPTSPARPGASLCSMLSRRRDGPFACRWQVVPGRGARAPPCAPARLERGRRPDGRAEDLP